MRTSLLHATPPAHRRYADGERTLLRLQVTRQNIPRHRSDESQRRGDDVGRGLGFGMSLAVVDHVATSSSSKGIPSGIDRRNDSAAIVDSTVAVVG